MSWTFAYDADDLRVLVENDAGYGEGFVYDPMGQARASYDAFTGLRTAAYVTGLGFGEVLARVDGAGVQRDAVRDRLGSTVGWLDGSGQVSEQVLRDAYGVLSATPAAVMPYGYTGHAEDPTGLVWGRARCYAPTTGAWTSEDPVFTEGRYGYVGAAPCSAKDPSGTAFTTAEYAVIIALDLTATYFVTTRRLAPCSYDALSTNFQRPKPATFGALLENVFNTLSQCLEARLGMEDPPGELV